MSSWVQRSSYRIWSCFVHSSKSSLKRWVSSAYRHIKTFQFRQTGIFWHHFLHIVTDFVNTICLSWWGSESPLLHLFHSLEETQMTTPPHPTPLTTHNNTSRRCLLPQWCCHLGSVCLYGQGQPVNLRVICCGGVVAPLAAWSNTPHLFPDHRLKCAHLFFGNWTSQTSKTKQDTGKLPVSQVPG